MNKLLLFMLLLINGTNIICEECPREWKKYNEAEKANKQAESEFQKTRKDTIDCLVKTKMVGPCESEKKSFHDASIKRTRAISKLDRLVDELLHCNVGIEKLEEKSDKS